MSKRVSVKASLGTKLYKVGENGGAYYCMKYVDSSFSGWNDIDKARGLEDGLTIFESHARKYGSVYNVSID